MKQQVIRFAVRRRPDGQWRGLVELPFSAPGKGKIPIDVTAATPQEAVKQAAGVAEQILASPVLQAALPPGASNAVAAMQMLAQHSATAKQLGKGLRKLAGSGGKRVISALSKLW